MTIREVIELVKSIIEILMEYLAPLFGGNEEGENAEGEGAEA